MTILTLYYGFIFIGELSSHNYAASIESPQSSQVATSQVPEETEGAFPSIKESEQESSSREKEQNQALSSTPSPTPETSTTSATTTPEPEPEKKNTVLPEGFVHLKEFLPEARFEIRYATTHNFTGRVVEGYLSDNVSLTIEAAKALKKASDDLKSQGYGILIYDAYRPKRAVDFFIAWSKEPENNLTKEEFYPEFKKEELFNKGYLAKRSGHSRGSTVDLTLYYLDSGELVDMGSPYDFLGTISNHGTDKITEEQTRNRNILKDAMKKAGFKELRTEWWHYELLNEPYPDTYFDFVVE